MNAIIVRSTNTAARTITRKDGSKVTFVEQRAAIDTGEEFPQPFAITLDEGQAPYPAGLYYVDPASFKVNQYSGLEMGRRVRLVRMEETKAKA